VIENLNNQKHLKYFRKKLHNNATKSKVYLWNFLQKSQLNGVKFRRQHSIGPYIVDFYSYKFNLAIELDGEVHEDVEMVKHDKIRDQSLARNSVKVLRFKNEELFENIDGVLQRIK
jgi:very-short-patch-repair endonuclease